MKTIDLEPDISIPGSEIAEWLKMPDSFAMFRESPDGEPKINDLMGVTWTLGPVILTRDSSIIEESNSAVLRKLLESREDLKGQWRITPCSHWACGWVDHLSFCVIEDDPTGGSIPEYPGKRLTRMAKVYLAWEKAMKGYPIADEEDVNKRTEEATLKCIADEGRKYISSVDAKENWPQQVMDYLHEFHNDALTDEDGTGPFIGTEILLPVMYELGILDLHHKSEFLLMQLNALHVFMEWGAQTAQSLRAELGEMMKGNGPHIDEVSAVLTQLQKLDLVAAIVDKDTAAILKRLSKKFPGSGSGTVFCRR